jgi:FtsX-like permease family
MMRRPRAAFLFRRMGAARLLLASMLLAILVTAALAAALAAFSARALPQAARSQLIAARSASIAISGQIGAGQAAADTAAIRSSMRAVFGPVPVRFSIGLWSDSLGLPAAGGSKTIPLAQAAALDQLTANAVLVSGSWPGPPQRGQPIQAALPAAVANRLRLAPGRVLVLPDRDTGAPVRIALTGLFRPRDPGSPYWGLDLLGSSGISVRGNFVTYGPLIVAPAAFGGSGLSVGEASWLVQPALARVQADSITGLAARVSGAQTRLTQSESLGGLTVTTTIPQLLRGIASNLVVARSLLLITVLQLMLLAAVAIGLAARMLAGQREEESALLSARGVTRWQLVRLTLAEAVVLATAAAAAGTLAGAWLAGPLSRIGPLRAARLHMSGWPASIWWTAAAILLICTVVMLWPAARPVSPGSARARRSRQARLAGAAQAGADIAVIVLGAFAVWQLRDYSAVGRSAAGHTAIDPVLVAAPTLALAGAALIPLRLLPALAGGADRLAARTRKLTGALASWEVSRRPIRQSGPVLLVILAVAAGTLALTQHATWRRAASDQAAFAAGSDVRVNLITPVPLSRVAAIQHVPGTTSAMPVASFDGGLGGQVLAVDARQAASVVLMRADESALPLPALWQEITPAGAGPGLQLPGRPARLELTASVRPAAAGPALAPLSVTLSVQDAAGIAYSVPADQLPADGRSHDLIAQLSAARRASYPLRLLGMALSYQLPPAPAPPLALPAAKLRARQTVRRGAPGRVTLSIDGFAVSPSAAGPFPRYFTTASALKTWHPAAASSDLANPLVHGTKPVVTSWQPTPGGAQALVFGPGEGYPPLPISGELTLTAGPPGQPIPAIATRAFLSSANTAVGRTEFIMAGQVSIPAEIVAAVRNFPTAGPSGLLIVDQSTIQQALASRSAAPLPANQWWLRTRPGAAGATGPRITGLPPGTSVVYRARMLAALLDNPLSAAPQQAVLAIAVAAGLLAALGFSVSVAASVRERRAQSAVLSALGVSRAAQARQLCLEELLLSAPAAVAGLVLGAGVAHLLVPAVTLTATATAPVPPALIELPLGWTACLAGIITAIPVLVAAATVARRSDPAAQLRAAEAV